MSLDIYITTCCQSMDSLYGATLVFPSLRVGFPHATVHVVDNCSIEESRQAIRSATERVDGVYRPLQQRYQHHQILDEIVARHASGSIVFLDPDIVFWASLEHWTPPALLNGRLITTHLCEFSKAKTFARLHTSFFWIRDVQLPRERQLKLRRQRPDFPASFRPISVLVSGQWIRWDTGAVLYGAMQEDAFGFGSDILDKYDHLFCGSHLSVIRGKSPVSLAGPLSKLHQNVMSDISTLRGAWRIQEDYFQSRLHALRELEDLLTNAPAK